MNHHFDSMFILLRQSQLSLKSPSKKHQKTVGAFDMGGASTEITFVPENPAAVPRGYMHTMWFNDKAYETYAYSYQCYGLNEAYRRYLAHLVQVRWLHRYEFD